MLMCVRVCACEHYCVCVYVSVLVSVPAPVPVSMSTSVSVSVSVSMSMSVSMSVSVSTSVDMHTGMCVYLCVCVCMCKHPAQRCALVIQIEAWSIQRAFSISHEKKFGSTYWFLPQIHRFSNDSSKLHWSSAKTKTCILLSLSLSFFLSFSLSFRICACVAGGLTNHLHFEISIRTFTETLLSRNRVEDHHFIGEKQHHDGCFGHILMLIPLSFPLHRPAHLEASRH